MRAASLIVASVAGIQAAPAIAQQVLEADPEGGRTVIDGPFRAIATPPNLVAINHLERLVTLIDLEEPEGVMTFSLVTGEPVRTVHIRRGDGPAELRGITSITPASDGGIYVSNPSRVLEFDSHGAFEASWSVLDLTGRNVCELDGEPAAIVERGYLVRRGTDGSGEPFGEWSIDSGPGAIDSETMLRIHYGTLLACTRGAAYIVTVPEQGPVGPFSVVQQEGPTGQLELPTEFLDERDWLRSFLTALDGQGNIVVISEDNLIWGAVIDPDTGCYAVLRNSGGSGVGLFRGIHGDSAVVLHRDYEDRTGERGRVVRVVHGTAARISLVPFRRVSGDACPGMFSSIVS